MPKFLSRISLSRIISRARSLWTCGILSAITMLPAIIGPRAPQAGVYRIYIFVCTYITMWSGLTLTILEREYIPRSTDGCSSKRLCVAAQTPSGRLRTASISVGRDSIKDGSSSIANQGQTVEIGSSSGYRGFGRAGSSKSASSSTASWLSLITPQGQKGGDQALYLISESWHCRRTCNRTLWQNRPRISFFNSTAIEWYAWSFLQFSIFNSTVIKR